jgi:hypothetical protein
MPSPHSWRNLSARRADDDARNAGAKAQRMARLRAAILAEVHGDGVAGVSGAPGAPANVQVESPGTR